MLAWLVALALGTFVARRRGFSWWKVLVTFTVALAAGLVGARLLDIATGWSYYTEHFTRAYSLSFTGFSLYGGLVAALVAGALLTRRFRLPLWRLADSAVPALAARLILMRVGCLLKGCCFGTTTALPWGIRYDPGSPAWALQLATGETNILELTEATAPVHPTQIYEIMAAALFCGLALWLLSRRDRLGASRYADGVTFLVFALSFTLFRLGYGLLRANIPATAAPGWFYPSFYLAICVVVGTCLAQRLRSRCTPALLPVVPTEPY